jgi:hypothetical protein
MNQRNYRSALALVLLLLAWSTSSGQSGQSTKPLNYGFVSPNTRNDLKLDEAIAGMKSGSERRMVRQASNLGCVVKTKIRAFRALGSWSDGAEYSVMLRMKSDEDSLRYVLSRLGRDAKQKSVLYFHPQPDGTALIYRLQPSTGNLRLLANALDRAGIKFRTIVPTRSGAWIYLVDMDNELRDKVRLAARRLRAKITIEKGTASFVGADQANQAKDVFSQHITEYETKHPNLPPTCDAKLPALSSSLRLSIL